MTGVRTLPDWQELKEDLTENTQNSLDATYDGGTEISYHQEGNYRSTGVSPREW